MHTFLELTLKGFRFRFLVIQYTKRPSTVSQERSNDHQQKYKSHSCGFLVSVFFICYRAGESLQNHNAFSIRTSKVAFRVALAQKTSRKYSGKHFIQIPYWNPTWNVGHHFVKPKSFHKDFQEVKFPGLPSFAAGLKPSIDFSLRHLTDRSRRVMHTNEHPAN